MIQAIPLTAVLLATAAAAAPRPAGRPAKGSPAAATAGWVTGRVLRAGKPAPGTRVFFYWADPSSRGWREAQAGPAGEFRFAVKPNQRQNVAVSALTAEGEAAWKLVQRFDQAPPKPAPVKLELRAPAALTGRVVTHQGEPAAATVRLAGLRPLQGLWPDEAGLFPPATLAGFQAKSRPDGQFRLEKVPAGTVTALALPEYPNGGAPPARLNVREPGEQPVGILVAARPALLTVTASRAGAPAAGAAVWLRPSRTRPSDPVAAILAQRAGKEIAFQPLDLDAQGTLRQSLAPGRYEVAFHGKIETVDLTGETTVRLTSRGNSLKGTVRTEDGKPAAGARLGVALEGRNLPWPPAGEAPTAAADGAFELPDFPWEADRITVRAVLGTSAVAWTGSPAELKTPLELTLKKFPTLTVRGRIHSGQPLPEARVALFVRDANGQPRALAIGTADKEAKFEIAGLRRGVVFQVGTVLSSKQDQFLESRTFSAPETGETLDLGDVSVENSAPSAAANYLPMAMAAEKDEEAAKEALMEYVAALRTGDAKAAHRLTSALDPDFDPHLPTFVQTTRLLLPAGLSGLRREDLHALRLFPGVLLAGMYDQGSDVGAEKLSAALRKHKWVLLAARSGTVVRRLALLHREEGGWKLLGGLPADEAGVINAAPGDHVLFGAPYPAPEAGPVLEAALAYFKAERERDAEGLRRLRAQRAVQYDDYPRMFPADDPVRPTPKLELETRLTEWDLALAFSYPRLLPELHRGALQPWTPDLKAFPYSEIRARNLAVLSYTASDNRYLMLLVRENGQWRILDPALPAGALR